MKILQKENKKYIRIIIGECFVGDTNLRKPIRSIRVEDSTVNEITHIIIEELKKRSKQ